ncbi:hypothetical protein LMH87_011897 [Akanthomyces muscarius]|uniref:Dimethylaniline monooxygenase n=1 Tax=Akanthomyces muscarius TaxID=2231603 RepID=A0A9W8QA19_AKAMU|nr:hypothetical protein LMH87_011897 [Akanthomyces muscarius]KAJ4151182.1 hypothetical protein LMH87_011897 [Akanthomyces muscarius]
MGEAYDIVVVGAGWFGLAAAKAASQLMPDETLAVLESAESCGGTWSRNRLYPGLKSNNMVGTYEHPDFPMTEARYGVRPDTHIPGAVLHQYLTDFAHHFGFFDRIQFRSKVDVVEPADGDGGSAWKLSVTGPDGKRREVAAKKLILATGLTSTPNMPTYKGSEDLGAPLFHAKDFCAQAPRLMGSVKSAVVVGGAKSAYDVAYAMVQDGATVDLVIRDNGHGPVWIAPAFVTPFKTRLDQLLLVRWMTWMAPCPWGGEDGFGSVRGFLHGTALGRFLVDLFWKILSADVVGANGYDTHPELAKLKPWHSAFWIGSGLSILNYQTPFFDLVKDGRIRVHIGQIDHMEHKTVVLADGTRLQTDVVVCSTGWKKESPIKFNNMDAPTRFGLDVSDAELAKLNNKADEDVLNLFPRLRYQPKLRFTPKAGEPLRLYRFIVPSTHVFARSIAFAGAVSSVNTATCAAAQGHWIAAYLSNRLDRLPSTGDEVSDEIMLHTQWGKWRYPCGYGASLPDFVFEGLPYVDLLLRDMGLRNNRKGSLFAELTKPYLPRDFRGLVEEWKALHDGTGKTA